MMNALLNLIKRAVTTNTMKDDGEFPIQQVQYMGRVGNVEIITPYGLHSSPPKDALGVMWNIQAQEENRAGIFNTPQRRTIKNLKEGEVCLFNVETGNYLFMKQDGTVIMNTDRLVLTGDLEVQGQIFDKAVTDDIRDIYNAHVHPENDSGGPTDPPTTSQ